MQEIIESVQKIAGMKDQFNRIRFTLSLGIPKKTEPSCIN